MTSDRVSNDHMSPVAPHALAQSVAELQTFLTEQDGVVTNITNEVSFGESIMLVLHELARLQHLRSPVTVSDEMVERAMSSIEGEPDLFITKGAMRWAITAALAPAEQEGESIAVAVLAWMVKHEWLDAGCEYYAADVIDALNSNAAPTHPGGDSRVVAWEDEISAPKDGTLVRLLVEPDPEAHTSFEDSENHYETIGFNQLSDSGDDDWHFAGWDWSHDCIAQGHGKVIGWRPFLSDALVPLSSLEAVERERDEAQGKLALIVDRIVYSDSYGVPGSDFMCCHLCSGGGAPGIPFEHDAACPVRNVEQAYEQWWDAQRESEDALRDAESDLAAMTAERNAALQAVDAFADICDELGVERDNEAGLLAAADLKASLAAARDALEKIACRHVAEQPLWWQLDARAALAGSNGNGQ